MPALPSVTLATSSASEASARRCPNAAVELTQAGFKAVLKHILEPTLPVCGPAPGVSLAERVLPLLHAMAGATEPGLLALAETTLSVLAGVLPFHFSAAIDVYRAVAAHQVADRAIPVSLFQLDLAFRGIQDTSAEVLEAAARLLGHAGLLDTSPASKASTRPAVRYTGISEVLPSLPFSPAAALLDMMLSLPAQSIDSHQLALATRAFEGLARAGLVTAVDRRQLFHHVGCANFLCFCLHWRAEMAAMPNWLLAPAMYYTS